jgi:uncharacterized caspase-like protein
MVNDGRAATMHHVMRSLVVVSALVSALSLGLLLPPSAAAQAPRAGTLTEERVALVIGNAAYKEHAPLDNPVNDARLIASRLEQAGFKVTRRENLDRNGMAAALRDFGAVLNENTVAVLYYAGHALQLRDQNYMIPIDAEIRSEDDIGLQGVDLTFVLGRMSRAKSRVNVVILDACRDNPFAKIASSDRQGLAQMDAPIGTLLAYATAPGKGAPDGIGQRSNSIYTTELARHLLTPGLPVELMFKRVREGVVRESRQLQVPWEHSSLLGEFAFVPGFAAAPAPAPGPTAAADTAQADAAAEAALWSSVQGSTRADEFRAYLRQYPNGRFADAARARIAALSVPAPAAGSTRADLMPKVGDTWRYRVTDQYRFGDVFVTARVDAVSADAVAETWTTTVDAKVRMTRVPLKPAFNPLPDWDAAPPEFAPYLQAAELSPGVAAAIGAQRGAVETVGVTLQPSWKGEEEVVVGAGRFRAQKLVLSGKTSGRGGPVSAQYTVWYAPAAKRIIKYEVLGQAGRNRQSTTFELTEYKLQ